MSAQATTKRRPLAEQVIVITGASSGIGLTTARLALERGAKVVIAARSGELEHIAHELAQKAAGGGEIEAVTADVSREDDVRRIAARALERFGRIDTWVNNAGRSIYGRSIDVPIDEMRSLFDTDFWGQVYGARIAVEHMRERGGALINVGSVVSDRAVPLQGAYSAAKHAVKAFSDALRLELEHDRIPVSVTLIKPGSIDTPFFAHAKNYLDEGEPAPPAPVYDPEAVARAILACAERPLRELAIGGASRAQFAFGRIAPAIADRVMQKQGFEGQVRSEPHEERVRGAGQERGDHRGHVVRQDAYSALRTRAPLLTALVTGLGVAALAAVVAATVRAPA